jgi:hypothetical protein
MGAFLDRTLGLAEVGLIVATAWCVGRALIRGTAPSRSWVILMLVGAATLAQPFGVRSHRLSRSQFYAPGMHRVAAQHVHAVRVAGVPLMSFVLYRRRFPNPFGAENQPSHQLIVRSWMGPGLLSNATPIAGLCESLVDPCWSPDEQTSSGASSLELWRTTDGRYRVRVLTLDENPPASASYPPGQYPVQFYGWEIRPAVTSGSGALYWILLAVAASTVALRRRTD